MSSLMAYFRLKMVTRLVSGSYVPRCSNGRVTLPNTVSMRMSLASQGLFVNDVAVRFAAQLLYELFSSGRIRHHGVLINLDSKRCAPIDIDPLAWKRFGYEQSE